MNQATVNVSPELFNDPRYSNILRCLHNNSNRIMKYRRMELHGQRGRFCASLKKWIIIAFQNLITSRLEQLHSTVY